MAGHSFDDYLETIYFLAFPIGEYRPLSPGSPTLAARVAEMLGVSRASAGEMLKRLEAEGLVERGENKELAPLADLGPGAKATIVRLAEHDGELLHWFYDQGLVPGAKVVVEDAQHAAGQLTVRLNGDERAVSEKAAAGLFVRPA